MRTWLSFPTGKRIRAGVSVSPNSFITREVPWVECLSPIGKKVWNVCEVLTATLALLVSSAAAAQECQTCSTADACVATYVKATSEAQKATKQAIRDWKQNLDRKASAEFSSRGTAALQAAMESQVRLELDRLKECLAKIK